MAEASLRGGFSFFSKKMKKGVDKLSKAWYINEADSRERQLNRYGEMAELV